MIRNLLVTALFLATAGISSAQTIGKCAEVIASTGQSIEKQGIIYSYTVGEPVIFTLASSNLMISQGFHQPDLCEVVSTSSPASMEDWKIVVSPNPTPGVLLVQYAAEKNAALNATVYDVAGKLMLQNVAMTNATGSELDCTAFPAGTYLLQLEDGQTRTFTVVRFVKI